MEKAESSLRPMLVPSSTSSNKNTQPSKRKNQYFAAMTVCLGATSMGTFVSWSSPVLPKLLAEDSPLPITIEQSTWIASILSFGALLGAIIVGMTVKNSSRKLTLILLSLPLLASWSLIILIKNLYVIYFARFLAGVALGGLSTVCPIYITEIAETEIRGTLGTFFQLFLSMGTLLTNILGMFLGYVEMSIILAFIPLALVIGLQFLPDSPIYLMKQGKHDRAEDAIRWLRGKQYNVHPVCNEMQKEIDANSGKKITFWDVFKTKGNKKALFASFIVIFFKSASGLSIINSYTVLIFQTSGSSINSNFQAICVAFVSLVLSTFMSSVVSRAGRKTFLVFSAATMAICLGTLGFYFQKKQSNDVGRFSWLPLACLMTYTAGFQLGFGPIPRIVISELFIADLRGYVCGLASLFGWFFGFVVSKSYGILVLNFGLHGTFYLFMSFCAVGIIFVIFFVPETKGKSLQDIQDKLNNRKDFVDDLNVV